MSLETKVDALIQEHAATEAWLKGLPAEWEQRVNAKELQVSAAIDGLKSYLPVTPNLLADTYQFASLCGGQTNTPMDIIAAHSGSLFAASYYGTPASVTLEVVTLDQLAAKGIPFGGDMELATNYTAGATNNFNGSSFRVLLFNAEITENTSAGGVAYITVLMQGCQHQSGWSKGQVKVQSQLLVNVVEATGTISFSPHENFPPQIAVGSTSAGAGWKFKHATAKGFGGCHVPAFRGVGKMKVAIALPYIGYGDHGGNFFWADSIRKAKDGAFRYSHFMGN